MNKVIKLGLNKNQMEFEMSIKVKDGKEKVYFPIFIEEKNAIWSEEILAKEYVYRCEENDITASIMIAQLKDGIWCKLSSEIKTKVCYDQVKTLAPIDSITLLLKPINPAEKIMGSYFILPQKNDAWASPFFVNKLEQLPRRTASVMWKHKDFYYHMLPLCDGDFKSEIKGNGNEIEIAVSPYTGGYKKINAKTFVLNWNENAFTLPEFTAEAGFKALGLKRALRKDKRLPELFDYLGWCTWDAFYKEVNAEGVYNKAKEFQEKKIPVKWHLIDDGWFEYEGHELLSITEDRNKFPKGLKNLIEDVKENYGVRWVGVWQCFIGYWAGIKAGSELAKDMKDVIYETAAGHLLPYPEEIRGFGFWNKWNTYLRNQGVDFVKSDVQNSLEAYINGNMAVGKASKGMHYAVEASAGLNFDGALINCTGMGQESIWNRPQGAVNRNSEDFHPSKPESMRLFTVQNIYNSYYHSQFYYTDWDMMWSKSPTTKMNVVLRAVSGGPVYVSDKVGESDAEVMNAFAFSDGKLLKCDSFGMPTEDVLFSNPLETPVLVKAWNKSKGAGIIGAFNTYKEGGVVTGSISPLDVPNLSGDSFVVYNWFSKEVKTIAYTDKINIELPENEANLYILAPIENGFGILGLVNKYVSTAAIERKKVYDDKIVLLLKEGGKFAYHTNREHTLKVNNQVINPYTEGDLLVLDCSSETGEVLVEIVIH